MLTKGIIQSIDLTTNKCTVRIPTFETAGNKTIFTAEAIISTLPGVYNGYKQDDRVVVGFGPGGAGDCVVIGKLYLGAQSENTTIGGSIHCSDLVINNSVNLPATTNLTFAADSSKATNTEVVPLSSYKTLKDLATVISNNTASINKLSDKKPTFSTEDKIVGIWIDDKNIWQRTTITTTSTTSVPYISTTLAWLDISNSFIQNTVTNSTRAITTNTITVESESTLKIEIPNLQTNEQAILTIRYIK